MNYHIVNLEQGTPEWLNARKGKLTASQAASIITPTGKLAAASKGPDWTQSMLAARAAKGPQRAVINATQIGKLLLP
jgi:hypothetical protein